MTFPLTSLFFFFSLLLGSILSISSSSWFGAWIGLELNLLSFIPLITIKMNSYMSEAALKYFLTQALASTVIIMSTSMFLFNSLLSSPIMLMALLLKVGAAPFHFWFPQVMEGLLWPQTLILMSIQKLAPMFLISYLTTNLILVQIISISAILSALIGGFGGFNITKLRKIMAFSSINHMSWMLVAISINDMMWLLYFSFYVFISSSIVILFHFTQVFTINDLFNPNYPNPIPTLLIPLSLLSLGGLPPFTGFLPKWMMIQILVTNKMIITLSFLLFSALITLYFYLRILIPFILLSTPMLNFNMKNYSYVSKMSFPSLILFSNLLGLILPLPITVLY
uniref:NADH-ubiquinone oxidoreductase chain 2 n=1 Tax=Daldorfia horrida TaxID=694121 RepID=A0A7D3U8Y5_9EUCA|nr:NADH dehydrogenase subunit 2 [Daldorfia horrida]QKE42629.1 NADH dehydrogenase subunit 2 [Daldorfia horrida]